MSETEVVSYAFSEDKYIQLLGSLSNDDGNVNENVEKQWIKLQNTISARGNATTCPLFRRRL